MMCNGWSVRAHSGDDLTEGGQCHVTCVRPRSEAVGCIVPSEDSKVNHLSAAPSVTILGLSLVADDVWWLA